MKRLALLCWAFALVWLGASSTARATGITLTLVPSASSVALGGNLTLTATVTGTTNLGLTWSVNGITNGSATQGTLTACTTVAPLTCKYTAPSIDVPNPNPVTFKIVSAGDGTTSKTATATVTDSIAMTLSPSSASLALAGTQVFTATITGAASNAALNWYVNGVLNGNSTQGTLSACTTSAPLKCTYTAPPVDVPTPNPAVIKVASSADPGKNKSANVTVTDPIAVTLTPTSANIALSGTKVFTATITGASSNAALNWYVNGVLKGSSTQGTLTACTTSAPLKCTYTAPPVDVPTPNPAVIKVASSADPGKNKTANVTVTDSIAVTLSPASASLALGGTKVLTATLTGTINTALNWYVNGVLNGNAAEGTLTACTTTGTRTCTYTAPPIDVPSPNPAVIKAASAADPGKNKTANLTVTDSITVTLTPASTTLAVSGTQVFTATVTGTTNTALSWYVNGILDGNATEGTLAGCTTVAPWKCTYTAPPINDPYPNPAVIKVASVADPSKSKTANVTVNGALACMDSGSDSLLSGQYAFSLSGYNDTGFLAVMGSLKVDGSGHITAGEADTNGALGSHTSAINTTSSSYSVGSNHLGCATIVTTFGTFNTRLAVGSIASSVAAEGRMVEWDDPTASSYIVATGHLQQQSPSEFSAGLSGSYAFENTGMDNSGGNLGMVGVMTAGSGSFSTGEMDMNDAGTINHLIGVTGTYTTPDSNGRSTSVTTWTGTNPGTSVFYIVSSSKFLILSKDTPTTSPVAFGEAQRQSGSFTQGSFNGTMVYYLTGLNINGPGGGRAGFGFFRADGISSVTATNYEDDVGVWSTPNPSTDTGPYTVAANGRIAPSGSEPKGPPVFYLTAANTGLILATSGSVEIGKIEPQTGGPFSSAFFSGTYYMGDDQVIAHGVASAEQVGVGVLTIDSTGFSLLSDYTATFGQQADHLETGSLPTVSSSGTISQGGVVLGIIISPSEYVMVDNVSDTYPLIEVSKR